MNSMIASKEKDTFEALCELIRSCDMTSWEAVSYYRTEFHFSLTYMQDAGFIRAFQFVADNPTRTLVL